MSICRMRMKVDLGGLKITPKMKRFMCVEVGRTSTMIQWWGTNCFFSNFMIGLTITSKLDLHYEQIRTY